MRVQRIILEHHRDPAFLGRDVVDLPVADKEIAAADRFKAGDHAQDGALGAARRTDEHHEFTVFDVEIDTMDSFETIGIYFDDFAQTYTGHS